MDANLRKVTFKLGDYSFDPDATETQQAEMEEFSKVRQGYFHQWVDDVDTSKDIPYVKTMALVEDATDGKLHQVESYNVEFKEPIQ